jgi:hypothetical protein
MSPRRAAAARNRRPAGTTTVKTRMAAEERTFLNPMTLRDDVIHRRTRELATE